MQFGLSVSVDEARVDGEAFSTDPHLRVRIGLQIPQPVRGWIFRDHVETSVTLREPDLDLSRQTTIAASRSEIEILLAAEAIGP